MNSCIEVLRAQVEITQILTQLESIGEWDEKNLWVKRDSSGRFTKNKSDRLKQEDSSKAFISSTILSFATKLLNSIPSIEDIGSKTQQVVDSLMNNPVFMRVCDRFKNISKNLGVEAFDAYKKVTEKFDSLKFDLSKAIKETKKKALLVLKGATIKPGLAAMGVIAALSGTVCAATTVLAFDFAYSLSAGPFASFLLHFMGAKASGFFGKQSNMLLGEAANIFTELEKEGVKQEIKEMRDSIEELRIEKENVAKKELFKIGLNYNEVIKNINKAELLKS